MRKSKIYISSIIIFLLLVGFLATPAVDAVEDFSGAWNGQFNCLAHDQFGPLQLNLTQNGAIVSGTMTMVFTEHDCNSTSLSGDVTGNVLSFNSSGYCGPHAFGLKFSKGILTDNNLSGNYTIVDFGCYGIFNLKRSVNYINATAGTGGTIVPAGKISVNAGADKTFNISPKDGYKILDVIVDGVSVGAKSSYTFSKVSANHTITATFETAATTGSIVPTIVMPLLLYDE